ncbi:MAG: hypothetical protein UV09_C0022G0024 [Candidatus Gottesmanbacteria bacterium GW2011_GWA2_42_18]|nr:MAG: hypothetical protein UV09_C0022G0024 [Candidatus Gottesmanbacteria bacterium GW2011_GWA2_42_18]
MSEVKQEFLPFLTKKPKTADARIEFHFRIPIVFPFDKKKNRLFFITYFIDEGDKILTYYYLNAFQFSYLLLYVLHKLLVRHQGFVLHASACLINDRIDLFMGPSGAGKTTVLNNLKKYYRPFADDTVIVRKKGSDFRVYQTPLNESNRKMIKASSKSYRLGRIFFIHKARSDRIDKIAETESVIARLSNQLRSRKQDKSQQFKTLLQLVNKKIFFELYFKKVSADLGQLLV